MTSDLAVPPLSAWPVTARVAALVLLAVLMLIGAGTVASARGGGPVAFVAMGVWAALAAYAWGHGRLALFIAVVPVFYCLAFGVSDQLDAPCGDRAVSPAIAEREEIVRLWPPHTVCEFRMVDGSREYDGGFSSMLWAPFLWACVASALALRHRPHVGLRAGLVVVSWFLAVALAFM